MHNDSDTITVDNKGCLDKVIEEGAGFSAENNNLNISNAHRSKDGIDQISWKLVRNRLILNGNYGEEKLQVLRLLLILVTGSLVTALDKESFKKVLDQLVMDTVSRVYFCLVNNRSEMNFGKG